MFVFSVSKFSFVVQNRASQIMEWTGEKLLQLLPIAVSVGLPLYMYFRSLKEKRAEANKEVKVELTTEILADGSSIRKEQGERLKDEQARYDKVVTIVEQLRDEIIELKGNVVDFRAEVKELKFVNNTQALDKKKLEDENDKLRAENVLLENEIRDLRTRVGDLETQVKNLMERERSG